MLDPTTRNKTMCYSIRRGLNFIATALFHFVCLCAWKWLRLCVAGVQPNKYTVINPALAHYTFAIEFQDGL